MGRLKMVQPRIRLAAPRLAVAQPGNEAERLKHRNMARPNWYSTARWRRLRLAALERDNWTCQQTGALLAGKYPAPTSPAVDHRVPHRWDPELFWDLDNLQSVTKAWHDSAKQRLERAGLA